MYHTVCYSILLPKKTQLTNKSCQLGFKSITGSPYNTKVTAPLCTLVLPCRSVTSITQV